MTYTKRELYGNAALRHDQVRAIRLRRGEHARALGLEYSVAPETIRKIWRGETYTMVSDEGPVARAPSQVSDAEIAASKARFLAMIGESPPPGAPAPSLEEALKAQALREEAAGSPGLDKLAAVSASLHRGDRLVDELDGQPNAGVILCPIPPALAGTSTDGEAK